jgi:hypothetical protein
MSPDTTTTGKTSTTTKSTTTDEPSTTGLLDADNPLVVANETGYLGTVPDDDTDYTLAGVTSGK